MLGVSVPPRCFATPYEIVGTAVVVRRNRDPLLPEIEEGGPRTQTTSELGVLGVRGVSFRLTIWFLRGGGEGVRDELRVYARVGSGIILSTFWSRDERLQ